MDKIYSKKKIFFIALPLLVVNIVLIFNFLNTKTAQTAPESVCYNDDSISFRKRLYSEEVKCDGCQAVGVGKEMFAYFGSSANCWTLPEREQAECFAANPYGGRGTYMIGGNLAVNNASGVETLGNDGSGYHWIMSSTEEPYGNVVGFNEYSSQVSLGNNLVVNKDININNRCSSSGVVFAEGDRDVMLSVSSHGCVDAYLGGNEFRIYQSGSFNINDSIRLVGGSTCDSEGAPDGYNNSWSNVSVDGLVKINNKGEISSRRITDYNWQRLFNVPENLDYITAENIEKTVSYDYDENHINYNEDSYTKDERYVGHDCASIGAMDQGAPLPEDRPSHIPQTGTYCNPQGAYMHLTP